MPTGLLKMSTGLLTKIKLFVKGCFNKSSTWGVLTNWGLLDARIR